jgi:predicted ArsR family transcriptional regulator
VLTAVACPYPELAEQDRGVCAMERMMFSEMVGERLKLTDCRLDGDACCRFVAN